MLIDKRAILQVLGSLAKNPRLLDDKRYSLKEFDFVERFYRIMFGAINNLHLVGNLKSIDGIAIDNFLSPYTEQYEIFNHESGVPYINSAIKLAEEETFNYYYERIKKYAFINFLALRGMSNTQLFLGVDGLANNKKRQAEFDSLTLAELTGRLDMIVTEIKVEFEINNIYEINSIDNDVDDLLKQLKLSPDIGLPVQGAMYNSATRGARLKKLCMRSAASGVGKTRLMVGNACGLSIVERYDPKTQTWVKNENTVGAGFITTELELSEIQTMVLAWITGINEDVIKDGETNEFEDTLLAKAAGILRQSTLEIGYISNFDSDDIELIMRRLNSMYNDHETKKKIEYLFFDYIHSTPKLLFESSSKTGMKLREDTILFLFTVMLKDLANELGVYIETASQLNGSWEDRKVQTVNALRGAKAMGDKLDMGAISLPLNEEEEDFADIFVEQYNIPRPNMVTTIYKNRGSKYKSVKIWSVADLGICDIHDVIITDLRSKPIENFKIKIANLIAFDANKDDDDF